MKPALRLHWPALLVLFLILALGAGALLLPADSALRGWAVVLWGVVPVAFAVTLYAYQRFDAVRLRVNRWRLTILNPASTWGLVAEFEVQDGLGAWKLAAEAVERGLRTGDRRMM